MTFDNAFQIYITQADFSRENCGNQVGYFIKDFHISYQQDNSAPKHKLLFSSYPKFVFLEVIPVITIIVHAIALTEKINKK